MSRTRTTLLVIDDSPDVDRTTERVLADAGFSVIVGHSAADAVALTRQYRPAVLLLEASLADGNGVEVARRIKTDPDFASVFVVMASSAPTSPEEKAAGLADGLADGYIVRPVARVELLAWIDAFLRIRGIQESLRTALREKDALLKEIHHRARNNLMLITSLLRLETHQVDHAAARAVLEDMEHRIQSLAMLHEMLYHSNRVTDVDLGSHLAHVAEYLFRSLATARAGVRLRLEMTSVVVATPQAITCGLLVNELVTNALKHAFPNGRGGEVLVSLQPTKTPGPRPPAEGRRMYLTVRDDGVGLPPDFSLSTAHTVGLQLVVDLARQLHSRLETWPGPGAHFGVTFIATPSPQRAPGSRP